MSDKKIRELGQIASEHKGTSPFCDQAGEQHRDFINLFHHTSPRRYTAKQFAFAGAFAVAATIVFSVMFYNLTKATEIPFRIEPDNATGAEGSWVEASSAQQKVIHFEGGSRFHLRKGGATRVIEANSDRVIVDLSRGELHCMVKGNGKTRWFVYAGTYKVVVTGTEFIVNWAPESSLLNVTVTKGSVLVSGATVKPHGVALSNGDHLKINSGEVLLSNKNSHPETPKKEGSLGTGVPQTEILDEQTTNREAAPKKVSHNKNKKSKPSTSQWKSRCAQKDYAGAISAAKAEGLDRLAQSLNADDLWQLSKAARFSRDGPAAKKLFLAVTTRFTGTPKAQNATFLLGRISEDLLHDAAAAQRWYEQYLSIGSSTALSEEALGRLFWLCHRSDSPQKAKRHAKAYLLKYPKGAFAKRAHSVLK